MALEFINFSFNFHKVSEMCISKLAVQGLLLCFSTSKKNISVLAHFSSPACRQEGALPTHLTDLSLPSLTVLYFYVEI